jgi:hypothetical protein
MILDNLPQVPDDQDNVSYALAFEAIDLVLKDWLAANFYHRLRRFGIHPRHSCASASRRYDSFYAHSLTPSSTRLTLKRAYRQPQFLALIRFPLSERLSRTSQSVNLHADIIFVTQNTYALPFA